MAVYEARRLLRENNRILGWRGRESGCFVGQKSK